MAGESFLKSEAIYYFTLACYECQLGDLENAIVNLMIAFKMDAKLRLRALDESDLKPLWDSPREV